MVSWPNEGGIVSVISDLRQRVSGPLVVGEVCEVTERRKKHPARVHATGLYLHAHVHVLVASF